MNKRISDKSPDLPARPNALRCRKQIIERAPSAGNRVKIARQYRDSDMQPHQHRGHIDRISTHPRNRPIIIGRGDPEHVFN